MQIRENGPDRLVLDNPTSALLTWFGGALTLFALWLGVQGARGLHDGPGWILLMGALALGGLGVVLTLKALTATTWAFDRASGRLVVSQRGPWRRAPQAWPLSALTGVGLSHRAGSENDFWSVAVAVRSAEPIALAVTPDEAEARRLASAVAGFLRVPIDEPRAG